MPSFEPDFRETHKIVEEKQLALEVLETFKKLLFLAKKSPTPFIIHPQYQGECFEAIAGLIFDSLTQEDFLNLKSLNLKDDGMLDTTRIEHTILRSYLEQVTNSLKNTKEIELTEIQTDLIQYIWINRDFVDIINDNASLEIQLQDIFYVVFGRTMNIKEDSLMEDNNFRSNLLFNFSILSTQNYLVANAILTYLYGLDKFENIKNCCFNLRQKLKFVFGLKIERIPNLVLPEEENIELAIDCLSELEDNGKSLNEDGYFFKKESRINFILNEDYDSSNPDTDPSSPLKMFFFSLTCDNMDHIIIKKFDLDILVKEYGLYYLYEYQKQKMENAKHRILNFPEFLKAKFNINSKN